MGRGLDPESHSGDETEGLVKFCKKGNHVVPLSEFKKCRTTWDGYWYCCKVHECKPKTRAGYYEAKRPARRERLMTTAAVHDRKRKRYAAVQAKLKDPLWIRGPYKSKYNPDGKDYTKE